MESVRENIVDRAKRLLITREHITENEAHRLILKRAMNLRITKTACALEIVERYARAAEKGETQETERKKRKTFVQGGISPSTGVFFKDAEARS